MNFSKTNPDHISLWKKYKSGFCIIWAILHNWSNVSVGNVLKKMCLNNSHIVFSEMLWDISHPSFRWDVKPRSWLSVVIKNPMALLVKSRGVSPVYPGQIPTTGPCQSWPRNNPHPLDWLYDSLSSPPVAGVWWAHWRRSPVAAVAKTTKT